MCLTLWSRALVENLKDDTMRLFRVCLQKKRKAFFSMKNRIASKFLHRIACIKGVTPLAVGASIVDPEFTKNSINSRLHLATAAV